jgi:hypothetical protein
MCCGGGACACRGMQQQRQQLMLMGGFHQPHERGISRCGYMVLPLLVSGPLRVAQNIQAHGLHYAPLVRFERGPHRSSNASMRLPLYCSIHLSSVVLGCECGVAWGGGAGCSTTHCHMRAWRGSSRIRPCTGRLMSCAWNYKILRLYIRYCLPLLGSSRMRTWSSQPAHTTNNNTRGVTA